VHGGRAEPWLLTARVFTSDKTGKYTLWKPKTVVRESFDFDKMCSS
jgi:hypothetical protein